MNVIMRVSRGKLPLGRRLLAIEIVFERNDNDKDRNREVAPTGLNQVTKFM